MGEVAHDAGLALAPRLGVGLGHIDPARDIDMSARRIGAQRLGGLLESGPIGRGLPGQLCERRPARQEKAEAHARRHPDRAPGRAGEEDRRVRLLQRMGKHLVIAVDLELEILALMIGAFLVEQVHQQRQQLFLDVAARLEIDAEAVEFVFAIARAKAEREAAIAQDVDEGGVLGDAQRIGERRGDHGGADGDPLGQRRQIGGIDEDVRHDAVFIAEVMFRHPRIVVAELVRAQDLPRHPRMHVAMRVGLRFGVGMGREKDAEFHICLT